MGKIARGSTDRDDASTPRPRRKRRKRDLDRMHSKILQAKRKLDNAGKDGKRKKPNQGKICNRLLPEPTAGIFRNGTKGKEIQKADKSQSTFHTARLKADALKLFNGDTRGSKCIVSVPTQDKTTEQSSNKDCMKSSLEWTLEQSPVLKPSRNQKPCLVRKKGEENLFEVTDSNTIKQSVSDESRHGSKEDVCKRRLFQNDGEQSETIIAQISDNTDVAKESRINRTETEYSNKSKHPCDPLNCFMKFCKISAEKFETDILKTYSDPVATKIKKLKHAYANSFRQQLLRKRNNQESENVEPTRSVEHQACSFSDVSQFSPVEFEVPKCSETRITAARLQEDSPPQKIRRSRLHVEPKKNNDATRNSSAFCSSRNTFAQPNTNDSVVKNCENNDNQHSKTFKDIRPLSKSTRFYSMNDKDFVQLDFQKNSKHANYLSKDKRHDIDDFSIDIPYGNLRHGENSKRLESTMFRKSGMFYDSTVSKRHFSEDYSRAKLPTTVSDICTSNISEKCNNETHECNAKNVKRVPTILRRYNYVTSKKPNHSVQIIDDCAEGLCKKCESNFHRNPSDSIEKEYETVFPNVSENLPTSSTMNAIFDQQIQEPQIGTMRIKDSQESQVEHFDINMYPREHNEKNVFYRYNSSLYPRTYEASHDTNAYSGTLPQRDQVSPVLKRYNFHSNNRSINYLQGASSNFNVEPTKEFPRQTKLHALETNKQLLFRKNTRSQNQNIFNSANDRVPTSIDFPQNIQIEEKSCLEIFDKRDAERTSYQINQNADHFNEQYIYCDSANYPRKYKGQAHYCKETAQPENLRDSRGYNNSVDDYVHLSNTMRDVPSLPPKQKNNLHVYPKAIDDQYRTVLLQNVTQPVKYLAVKNGSEIQRIPVYISDKSARVAENGPLKLVALMDPGTQTEAQEIATRAVPLQMDSLQFNDLAKNIHRIPVYISDGSVRVAENVFR
ncbi:PREDICTED: uncharacterized protein LOC105563828 [Vollenhovia emeryi]|uniref:uncharacterized protein LOC105563828 n=1 Tax=Vollenhovia emeryi TaxID=411798 RepID=UPI0005F52DC9|nr:PREDICTED: uncharacterized protein LOC105563828 [Vollenhovia emeryi]